MDKNVDHKHTEIRQGCKVQFDPIQQYNEVLTEIKQYHKVLVDIKQNIFPYEYLETIFKNNKKIILAAVRQDGYALYLGSKNLRNDREVVFLHQKN